MKTAKVLKGFRDILPQQALIKTQLIDLLKKQFQNFAYLPIETPHLEYTELLIDQSSEEISKQLYRFKDNGDRDVCLRFDLTVPFARFVVQHQHEIGLPFKRYAIGNVFRGENPQFGRYREFTQCDIDFVGTESVLADAEIIQIMATALKALSINNFVIRINNRKLLNGISKNYQCHDRISSILRVVDKIDKIGKSSVLEELKTAVGLNEDQITAILKFIELESKSGSEMLVALKNFPCDNEEFLQGVKELNELVLYLNAIADFSDNYVLDVSIARGLGYYTGIVYETNLKDLPELGSVCSGGRYDNLTQQYTKERISGVGASFGLDRLLAGMEKLGLLELSAAPAKLICMQVEQDCADYVIQTAAQLRASGLSVEVYPDFAKLKKQFQYAEKKNYQYALILGSAEKQSGLYNLKDLKTQQQHQLSSIAEICNFIS